MIYVSMLLEQYKEAIKFLHHTIKDKSLTPDEILEREDVHTKTANDRIYKAVMEIIGKDEENMMNRMLQVIQRQRADKFFGRDK